MTYKPSEQHDTLGSVSYGKYDDMRMAWVGRLAGPRVFNITDTSQKVALLNDKRVWIKLTNDGSNKVYLNYGEAAVAAECDVLNANGGVVLLDKNSPWPNEIFAVCAAGLTSTLLVNDVSQETESGRGE